MNLNQLSRSGYHNRFHRQQPHRKEYSHQGHMDNSSLSCRNNDVPGEYMYDEMIHDTPLQDAPSEQAAPSSSKKFMAIKSHGKSTAIEVAPDLTMKNWFTIKIEGASKINDQSKAYDWKNKISLQITKNELPLVIGVLLGYLPEVEFKNHGESNKGVSIENQGKNFYFKIMELSGKNGKPRLYVCPVPVVEAHLMGMLALTEYIKNFEGMSADAALSAIKIMCVQLYKNEAYPKISQKR